jgi:hypothetical protein
LGKPATCAFRFPGMSSANISMGTLNVPVALVTTWTVPMPTDQLRVSAVSSGNPTPLTWVTNPGGPMPGFTLRVGCSVTVGAVVLVVGVTVVGAVVAVVVLVPLTVVEVVELVVVVVVTTNEICVRARELATRDAVRPVKSTGLGGSDVPALSISVTPTEKVPGAL